MNYIINDSSNVGDTSTCRLHLRGAIEEHRRQFLQKHGHPQFEIPPFKWQKSFYGHAIRGEKDFYTHCRYAVYNPAKHGLPDTWSYTSLNYEDMLDRIEW